MPGFVMLGVFTALATSIQGSMGSTKATGMMVKRDRKSFRYKKLPSTVEKPIEVTNTATLRQELHRLFGETVTLSGSFRNPSKATEFSCERGHTWRAVASDVIAGKTCLKCPRKKTDARYKADLKARRGSDLVAVENYAGTDTGIMHECGFCGHQWRIAPKNAIDSGYHCPACKSGDRNKIGGSMPYSSMAIDWLESEAKRRRIFITHAGNGGERTLPGSRLKVDGYNHDNRMVFEFHGDIWHGNLKLFGREEHCHPFRKHSTAKELNIETIDRLEKIHELGYVIVHIWENDWKAGRPARMFNPKDPDTH